MIYLKHFIQKIPTLLIIMAFLFAISFRQDRLFGTPTKNIFSSADVESTDYETGVEIDTLASVFASQIGKVVQLNNYWNEIRDESGDLLGYMFTTHDFAVDITGYAGPTPVAVIADKGLNIKRIVLLENDESPRFVNRIIATGFFESWTGCNIGLASKLDVTAVSGASMTSDAVIQNVRIAIDSALVNIPQQIDCQIDNGVCLTETPLNRWQIVKWIAVAAVLALSLSCYFYPSRFNKKYRILLLLSSVLVIGVWQGSFISLSLLYGWLLNGVAFGVKTAVILSIVVLALILPLVLNKNYYCNYLCPFGALQELTGKCVKNKMKIPEKVLCWLLRLKRLYLPMLMLLLLIGINLDLSDFEPFAIFMFNSVSLAVIILASISIILSLFIHKPWCHFVCPTGEFLTILTKPIKKKK